MTSLVVRDSPLDLAHESAGQAVAVSFPKTRAAAYPLALELAKRAARYGERQIGATLLHFAIFARTREQASLALSVLRYVRMFAGVQIYGGGQLLPHWYAVDAVLTCYLQATACEDWRAHCHIVRDQPPPRADGLSISLKRDPSTPVRYIIPCSYLRDFRIQPDHPSGLCEQLQAAAVAKGCDWCPNFDHKELRECEPP